MLERLPGAAISVFMFIGMMGLLAACSSLPAELSYSPESDLIPYSHTLVTNPQLIGKPVRWSGLIANTRILANTTEIEVVYLNLRSNGLPEQQEQSPGRFLVRVAGFLDPQLYAPGRSISVLGQLQQIQTGHIGEHEYIFPVLRAEQYRLWPKQKEIEIRYVHDPLDDLMWTRPR